VTSVVLAAVISTLTLEGDVTREGGDYVVVPFEVPAGTAEILFRHGHDTPGTTLDFGLEDPDGFRGWGGRLGEDTIVGGDESSRCYLPGPIQPGTWRVDIGKAFLSADRVHWTVTLELRDAASLAPRPRAPFEARVLERGGRWYRGDFHVHSSESGDAGASLEAIRDLARARGLDFVNLSDHNTVSQQGLASAFQDGLDDLLLLRGSEVTTYGGHGTSVGNPVYIEHHIGRDGVTIEDALDQVAAAGAIFIINHPKLDLGDGDFCIGCPWSYGEAGLDRVSGIELATGAYDYVPVFGRQVLAMWDGLLDQGHRITGTGGSDDHDAPFEPGPQDSQIGTPCTVVWADELSEAAIIEGVRRGRVVVKLRGPDDPMVELTATGDDGRVAMIGDTVRGARVRLSARVEGGAGMTLSLWRNGVEEESLVVDRDDFTLELERVTRAEGDRYRLQLAEAFDVVITNHIWVEPGDAPADDGGCGCGAAAGGGARWLPPWLLALLALLAVNRPRHSPCTSCRHDALHHPHHRPGRCPHHVPVRTEGSVERRLPSLIQCEAERDERLGTGTR
jgi:MYXO-CTERM domain-containing protein